MNLPPPQAKESRTMAGKSLSDELRESAAAFRRYPIYTADGDPVHLTVQADEIERAADAIEQQDALIAEHKATKEREAELERLVAEADAHRSVYAKVLVRLKDRLLAVSENIEDEGDRVYFGSTMHADDLKESARELDELHWDDVMAHTQPPLDFHGGMERAYARAVTAEAQLARVKEGLRWIAAYKLCPVVARWALETLQALDGAK